MTIVKFASYIPIIFTDIAPQPHRALSALLFLKPWSNSRIPIWFWMWAIPSMGRLLPQLQGAGIAELMRAAGYDPMTSGNHDRSYGAQCLKELEDISQIPILASHVVHAADVPPTLTLPVASKKFWRMMQRR